MLKIFRSNRPLSIACLTILIPSFIWFLMLWVIGNLEVRYFYVAVFFFAVFTTIVVSFSKHKQLLAIAEGQVRQLAISRMKFFAELTAAFSLMAFFSPYYLAGLEMDKKMYDKQWTHLAAANTLIQKNMTTEYCTALPYRAAQCKRVQEKVNSLFEAITDGIAEAAYTAIGDLVREVKGFELPSGSVERRELDEAIDKLNVLDLRDSWVPRTLEALPLLASLFASLTISSKVAVAWVEWTVRKTEQQTKQQEIKANEQLEHIRLMEEAAHKEQLNY